MESSYPALVVGEAAAPNNRWFACMEYGPDERAAQLLADFAELAASGTGPVVLDLRRIDYMDSGGVAVLFQMMRTMEEQGRTFSVCARDDVRDALRITRLDRRIPCCENVESAAAMLGG